MRGDIIITEDYEGEYNNTENSEGDIIIENSEGDIIILKILRGI